MRNRPVETPRLAEQFAGLRADYSAARQNRFRRVRTGLLPLGSNADWHYRVQADYFRMVEYARDMDRNDPIVGQVVDRACTNTIQDGLRHDPTTGDKGVDEQLRVRFHDWGEDPRQCDLAGEQTWWDMQWLCLRHSFVDGDIFPLPNVSGALELVENHRCRTPLNTILNVIHGIKLNPLTRRREQYWFTKSDVAPTATVQKVGDMMRYDAYDAAGNKQIFHVRTSKRVSQTRGVTAFNPIFDVASMTDDVQFATLVQKQMVTCFAVFEERDIQFSAVDTPGAGNRQTDFSGGFAKTLEGIGPGMHIRGDPGVKLRLDSPHVPNAEYFPFMRLLLTMIGINLGMPLVMVLMDASETNFSGWRGALEQARMGFRHNQRNLRYRLCQPVYEWKLRQFCDDDPFLAAAAERLGPAFFKCRWNAPTWPYIQPAQDAAADLLRKRNGLISGRRWAAERGFDYDTLTTEICEDNASFIEKAQLKADELNARHPNLGITWREVASMPSPDGVNIRVNAEGDAAGDAVPPGQKPANADSGSTK